MIKLNILLFSLVIVNAVYGAQWAEIFGILAEKDQKMSMLEESIQQHTVAMLGKDIYEDQEDSNLAVLKDLMVFKDPNLGCPGMSVEMHDQTFAQLFEEQLNELEQSNFEPFLTAYEATMRQYLTFEMLTNLQQKGKNAQLQLNEWEGLINARKYAKKLIVVEDKGEQIVDDALKSKEVDKSFRVFLQKTKDFFSTRDNIFRHLFKAADQVLGTVYNNEFNPEEAAKVSDRVMFIVKSIIGLSRKLNHEKNQSAEESFVTDSSELMFQEVEEIISSMLLFRENNKEKLDLNPALKSWTLDLLHNIFQQIPTDKAMEYIDFILAKEPFKVEDGKYMDYLRDQYNQKKIPFDLSTEDYLDKVKVRDYLNILNRQLNLEEMEAIVGNFKAIGSVQTRVHSTQDFTVKAIELLMDIEDINKDKLVDMTYAQRLKQNRDIKKKPHGVVLDALLNKKAKSGDLQNQYLIAKMMNLWTNLVEPKQSATVKIDFDEEQAQALLATIGDETTIENPLVNLLYRMYVYEDPDKEINEEMTIEELINEIEKRDYEVDKLVDLLDKELNFVAPSHYSNQDDELDTQSQNFEADKRNLVNVVIGELEQGEKLMLEEGSDMEATVKQIVNMRNESGELVEYVLVSLQNVNSPCYEAE